MTVLLVFGGKLLGDAIAILLSAPHRHPRNEAGGSQKGHA
jgi:hypothetical protein